LIEFAAEIGVAAVAHTIERRRVASEAAKPLRDDVFDPAKPARVRLRAIDAGLLARRGVHTSSGRVPDFRGQAAAAEAAKPTYSRAHVLRAWVD
jgi:hypothetical protein